MTEANTDADDSAPPADGAEYSNNHAAYAAYADEAKNLSADEANESLLYMATKLRQAETAAIEMGKRLQSVVDVASGKPEVMTNQKAMSVVIRWLGSLDWKKLETATLSDDYGPYGTANAVRWRGALTELAQDQANSAPRT